MNQRFRLGILGLGFAGATMLEVALRHEAVDVVAVADPDTALRDIASAAVSRCHEGLDGLVEATDLDGVYVATPTTLHVSHAGALLRSGKHVVVEKPVAKSVSEGEALVRLAADCDRTVVVGHSMSFEPYVRMVAELAREERLGSLRRLIIEDENDWMRRPRLPEELDESQGGGPVFRQGAHLVDVARFLTQGAPIRELAAIGGRRDPAEPYGSFVADFLAGKVRCTLSFNGWGPRIEGSPVSFAAAAAAAAAANESDRKHARNRSLLGDAVAGTLAAKLAQAASGQGGRRIVAVYDSGTVGVRGGTVSTRAATVDPATRLTGGRRAVLDELVHAAHGGSALHDGEWGVENLRVTVDVLEQIRAADRTTGGQPVQQDPTKET